LDKPLLLVKKNKIGIIANGKMFNVRLPIFSIFDLPELRSKSIVVGFIGARGSGKSVNAAKTVLLSGLLKGKRVWSNMEVAVNACLADKQVSLQTEHFSKLRLKDLDTTYSNGFVYIDEINMEIAEARRAQANVNLESNYFVQQLRKRKLNFVWSAQSEMHVDSRLRWQTDIFVKCTDISKPHGPGELSRLEYYDYSGMVKHKMPASSNAAMFKTSTVLNKPWWWIYDTFKLQGMEDSEEGQVEEMKIDPVQPLILQIVSEVEDLIDNTDVGIRSDDIWRRYQIWDLTMQQKIARALNARGIRRNRQYGKYERVVDYAN